MNFLENSLFLVPSANSVGTSMIKRKGKAQWNAKFQKSDLKDSLVPGWKKEDVVWSSCMDDLSGPPILLLWEGVGAAWEDPVWKNTPISLGQGWGTEREDGKENHKRFDWSTEKKKKKSRSLNVLILVSNSLSQVSAVTSTWAGRPGAISDCQWIV